ncbi:MAG: helix-turn-helix domain-containing protein [Terriglobales bacterium]
MCEPLIDATRAAAILGLHPKTLKGLAASGRIPGMKIGSVWRFRESTLDNWVTSQLECSSPLAAAKKGADSEAAAS